MSMVEDDIAIEKAVKAFLNDALDLIESGAMENDTDQVGNIVGEMLDAVTEKAVHAIKELCEADVKSNNVKDAYSVTDEHTDDDASTKEHADLIESVDLKPNGQRDVDVKSEEKAGVYVKAKEQTEDSITTEGHGDGMFPNFSKLALYNVKVKRGKVKIYHGDNLSKEEKAKLKREAKELFDYIGMLEKQKIAEQKRAKGQEKGVRAGIRRFFRRFCCWGSKTDD